MLVAKIQDDNGVVLGLIPLAAKDFKTGSRGFFGQGKLDANGERLQVQVQAVVIGSKSEQKEVAQ